MQVKRENRNLRKVINKVIHATVLLTMIILFLLIIGNQYSIIVTQRQSLYELTEIRVLIQDENYVNRTTLNSSGNYPLTSDERDLVQRIVAAEARGESQEGQMAVAQTILDRAELWDMSIREIALYPGQYAKPYRGIVSESVNKAVENVFDVGIRIFPKPVTHFYSGKAPDWAKVKMIRGRIGTLTFCY